MFSTVLFLNRVTKLIFSFHITFTGLLDDCCCICIQVESFSLNKMKEKSNTCSTRTLDLPFINFGSPKLMYILYRVYYEQSISRQTRPIKQKCIHVNPAFVTECYRDPFFFPALWHDVEISRSWFGRATTVHIGVGPTLPTKNKNQYLRTCVRHVCYCLFYYVMVYSSWL